MKEFEKLQFVATPQVSCLFEKAMIGHRSQKHCDSFSGLTLYTDNLYTGVINIIEGDVFWVVFV